MSFLRGYVRKREMLCIRRSQSMGGGAKKLKSYRDGIRKHRFHALAQSSAGMTCFLLPVSTSLRGDDIAVVACFNLKDTSNQPPMSFPRGYVRKREMLCIRRSQSMGGGAKKLKSYRDGIRKHRFLTLAQPSVGMTCFLLPVSTCLGREDILSEACITQ